MVSRTSTLLTTVYDAITCVEGVRKPSELSDEMLTNLQKKDPPRARTGTWTGGLVHFSGDGQRLSHDVTLTASAIISTID